VSARRFAALALGLTLAACSNAGEGRVLSVTATGTARGAVYMDNNGNGQLEPGVADTLFAGLRLRLVLEGTDDTLATAVSTTAGQFRMDSVPVGRYRVVLDTAILGDTLRVVRHDSALVTIRPGDSVLVNVLVGFPQVSVAQARALAVGRKVWVVAVALSNVNTFRDTTLSVTDTARAIRLERMRSFNVFTGDSVRLFGTTERRAGQPVLRNVTAISLGSAFLPPAESLSSGEAASAQGGVRDAELVVVARVEITDTATVGSDFRLTVRDSIGVDSAGADSTSGLLEVILDPTADAEFGQSFSPFFRYVIGRRFTIFGILVPTGATGVWQLKPRSRADLIQLP
jgi:hypothetical protein